MKIKLDENVPVEAAVALRAHGHDAATVLDEKLGGCHDPVVLAACQSEDRVIITLDTDFSNIVAYPPANHVGVVVLRLKRQSKKAVVDVIERLVVTKLGTDPIKGMLWVVDETRIRVHG